MPSRAVGEGRRGGRAARARRRVRRAARARRAPPERATIRPRRSTTCTNSAPPPSRPSSAPGAVSRSGVEAASRATSAARARSVSSSEPLSSCAEQRRDRDRRAARPRATIAAAAASATRARRPTLRTAHVAVEPEADAAHGVDQRRVAELAAQVGDVAVDDVRRRLALAAPHLLERELAGDDAARVAQQQREQLGLAAGELEVAAAAAGGAGLGVEREVGERELLVRGGWLRRSSARTRARQLVDVERLDEVVVGAGVEPGDALVDARRGRSAAGSAPRRPFARSRRVTARPSSPGIATSSTISVGHASARPRPAPRRRRRPPSTS